MKKIIAFLLCISALSPSMSVFAENTQPTSPAPEQTLSETSVLAEDEAETPPTEQETADAAREKDSSAVSDETTDNDKDNTSDKTSSDIAAPPDSEPVQSPQPAAADPNLIRTSVSLQLTVEQLPDIKPSDAAFSLYSADGTFLDSKSSPIVSGTNEISYVFDVPQYTIGETFKLKLDGGLTSVCYYSDTYYEGQEIQFTTYSFFDNDGVRIISDGISISARPYFNKTVSVTVGGKNVDLYPGAKLIGETTMVPIRKLAEYLGFDVSYDSAYNTEVVSLGTSYMFFNVDTAYTTVFGTDLYAPSPTVNIDGTIYVALRTFADAAGCTLNVQDKGTYINIDMSQSKFVNDYYAKSPVNQWGIASRTPYMVWVSLSEYKVRLYQGQQYRWRLLREAPCAIGAPGTPTVTGSFEYQYRTRWDYGTYYVGPCLVFYRGYALHSVLLYQNGTEYDGRVGVQISHGCVRLKKKDIDYIASTIPVGTRIYITR
jgi:hypothetical protein